MDIEEGRPGWEPASGDTAHRPQWGWDALVLLFCMFSVLSNFSKVHKFKKIKK